jgi:hypothetical protein
MRSSAANPETDLLLACKVIDKAVIFAVTSCLYSSVEIEYLDCSFMFVQTSAISGGLWRLQFKPGIGTCVEPLNAYLLQLTVDRLNRMTIHAQFDSIHKPGVRTHVRPAHRDQSHPRLSQDARLISGALVAATVSATVRANNYSPLPPLRSLRPTAAPRRADHTPVHARASGRATPWAASESARARHPGGRRDAHAIQRTSPVWPRSTRRVGDRAPCGSAGRAPGGTPAQGGYQ